VNSYLLGEIIGAALPAATIAFLITRQRFTGAVPFLVALAAGAAGAGGMLAFNATILRLDVSDADIVKLESGFNEGCVPSCTATGTADAPCRNICSCVLTRLHARYPSNEQFASWFRNGDAKQQSVKKEAAELSTSCAQAAR